MYEVFNKIAKGVKEEKTFFDMKGAYCKYSTIGYTSVYSKTIYLCSNFHNINTRCFGLGEYDMKTKEGMLLSALAQIHGETTHVGYNVKEDMKLASKTPDIAVENSGSYMRCYCSIA